MFDFSKYSPKQAEAIRITDKHLRIIACAGSGKTRTLVGKITYLLDPENEFGISPDNIIAFTYTDKAASELKNRILNEVGNLHLNGMANMYIGTIHGWCLKVLQENEYFYQNFTVLDEIKLKIFIDKYYETIGMKEVTKLSNDSIPLKRFVDTSIFVRIMDIIRESHFAEGRNIPDNLKNALSKYEKKLTSKKYFDFSMIMDKALESLKQDGNLTKSIRQNIKYLFVDEYQDVNPIQENLINKIQSISNCKLIVVGDDDQNIYQWRGSNNRYIIEFDEKFKLKDDVKDIRLSLNYRSSEGITRLAETLISNNKKRIADKEMLSAKEQVFVKDIDVVYNEFPSVEDENEEIAKYIEAIKEVEFSDGDEKNRGIAYSDICILLRKWNKAEGITTALKERGIPFITAGVNQLFDTDEVKAALGIFEYLKKAITEKELIELWLNIPNNKIDSDKIELAIYGNKEKKITGLVDKFPDIDKIKDNWEFSLQDILWNFLETAEIYEDSFINTSNDNINKTTRESAEIIFYNLGKFSQVINDFEQINFNSNSPSNHLFFFLNFITYVARDYYPEGWLNNEFKTLNAVQIMTIHQSKGLEFPVVIIPGLNKNYLPSKRKGGLNEWHFLEKTLIKEQERYEGDYEFYEDERRLLYVAITRSQKYLFISRAPDLSNQLYTRESMFVQELLRANVLVSGKSLDLTNLPRSESKPKEKVRNIILDFTTLKDFFECPYRFKLVSLYGFCFPLNQRMGVGRSFHNSLMELHKRIKEGEVFNVKQLISLADSQTYFPYLTNSIKLKLPLWRKVRNNFVNYYNETKGELNNIQFIEQDIQYKLDDNILVLGRIDLIKKEKEFGRYETTIVDFKSSEDKLSERVTDDQLKMYALGHRELTGETADYIMTYIIGEGRKKAPYPLKKNDLDEIEVKIKNAADNIRNEEFSKVKSKEKDKCESCFQNRLCIKRLEYGIKSKR